MSIEDQSKTILTPIRRAVISPDILPHMERLAGHFKLHVQTVASPGEILISEIAANGRPNMVIVPQDRIGVMVYRYLEEPNNVNNAQFWGKVYELQQAIAERDKLTLDLGE